MCNGNLRYEQSKRIADAQDEKQNIQESTYSNSKDLVYSTGVEPVRWFVVFRGITVKETKYVMKTAISIEWKKIKANQAASLTSAIMGVLLATFLMLIGCGQSNDIALPEFDILLEDGTILNTEDIPEGKPIVLIYYDGGCDKCHDEARDIMERMGDLKDVRFYFVTIEPLEEVRRFTDHLGLEQYTNITVGKDVAWFLPEYLEAESTPVSALYDKGKNLRGIFGNKPPIDTLIKKIREL